MTGLVHQSWITAERNMPIIDRSATLQDLTRQARALADGAPPPAGHGEAQVLTTHEAEVARMLQICNACRYCEGFCAVFPAMARRIDFPKADIHYLANLCHECGACLHACQYAPPHEFAVSLPQAMAQVRAQTWADYAWPQAFAGLLQRRSLTTALALAAGMALFLLLAVLRNGTLLQAPSAGNFYAVFPHGLMVGLFAPVFAWACLALGLGVRAFWRDVSPGLVNKSVNESVDGSAIGAASGAALQEALSNTLRLRYLDGGHGEGCNDGDDRFTLWRRRFHHATFYGFMACFAATAVATLYHYGLGRPAPYELLSAPVLLGTLGGIGLLIGPAGLWWLKQRRAAAASAITMAAAAFTVQPTALATSPDSDSGLIALLFFTSATGLALLAWRDTAAMAALLAIHLGFVMAFFLTLPYGRFAHGLYRGAALLKWSIERRQATRLKLGAD